MASKEIVIDWQAVKTDVNDRKLPPGTLVRRKNTYFDQDGKISKRKGYDLTEAAGTGGSFGGPATEQICADEFAVRVGGDQIYERSGDALLYRGRDRRCFPRSSQIKDLANWGGASKPQSVIVGDSEWMFSMGHIDSAGTASAYQLSVRDKATKATTFEPAIVSTIHADGSGIGAYSVVVDGSTVWLFFIGDDGSNKRYIRAHKWSGAPSTAPTVSTVVSNAIYEFSSIDARILDSGTIYIAATSSIELGAGVTRNARYIASLNKTTGVADLSGASTADVTGMCGCTGVAILDTAAARGGDGSLRISWVKTLDATHASVIYEIFPTGPAGAATTHAIGSVTILNIQQCFVTSGYYTSLGTLATIFATNIQTTQGAPTVHNTGRDATVTVYSTTGASTSSVTLADSWLASRPFRRDSAWHVLTGFDDGAATAAQRGYYVRRFDGLDDGAIVTQVLEGSGSWPFFFSPDQEGKMIRSPRSGHVVYVNDLGSDVWGVLLLEEDSTKNAPVPSAVRLDFAAEYFSSTPGILPGGVVKFVSSTDVVADLSPLHFPYRDVSFVDGDNLAVTEATVRVAVTYAMRSSKGEWRRSSPGATQTLVFHAFTVGSSPFEYSLTPPRLEHAVNESEVWIEIWGSVNNGAEMYLQRRIPNNPPYGGLNTIQVTPLAWDQSGELLYTTGSALRANNQPPPSRLAFSWGDRDWLVGDEIWFSQERQKGRGPEFNTRLVVEWPSKPGEILAAGPVNSESAAIFCADGAAIITGKGPDGIGQGGNFQLLAVHGAHGCSNPASLVQHPEGALIFQRHKDGRMCALSGQTVVEVNSGVEHLMPFTVVGAVDDTSKRQLLFALSDGSRLAMDYGHRTADQPYGQWVEHTSAGLTADPAIGLRLTPTGPAAATAGDAGAVGWWDQGAAYLDNGTPVLKHWKTTRIAVAGFMGEFDGDKVDVSCTHDSGGSAYRYTFQSDNATETHDDAATSISDAGTRLNSTYRTREIQASVDELSGTGAGRTFDGMVIEAKLHGRLPERSRKVP